MGLQVVKGVTVGYGWLCVVKSGYGWLRLVVGGYRWLRVATSGYGWLRGLQGLQGLRGLWEVMSGGEGSGIKIFSSIELNDLESKRNL